MSLNWVGVKPSTFVNNSTITPIDEDNLNSMVDTIDKIAVGGIGSGLDADTLQGIALEALNTPSDENLINFYPLDTITGATSELLLDESGSNSNGTAYNVSLVKGIIGMAGSFNGTTAYASGPYTDSTAYSISIWFKGTTSSLAKPLLLLKSANNAYKLGLFIDAGTAQLKFKNAESAVQTVTGSIINDGIFHHIVATHSGTIAKLYIDGYLIESATQSLLGTHYSQWVMCCNEAVTPNAFTAASIDDVRLYSVALTADEIYGLFFTKIGTKSNSLTFITPDEKAALAGTTGLPSSANKYVTDTDVRLDMVTTTTDGLMYATDKVKVDNLDSTAIKYALVLG